MYEENTWIINCLKLCVNKAKPRVRPADRLMLAGSWGCWPGLAGGEGAYQWWKSVGSERVYLNHIWYFLRNREVAHTLHITFAFLKKRKTLRYFIAKLSLEIIFL